MLGLVRTPLGRDTPTTLRFFGLPRSSFGSRRSGSVWARSGGAGRFGRPAREPLPFFDLLAPYRALHCAENPRVGSSILPLATIFNSMIFMRFPASPGGAPGVPIPTRGLSGFGWVAALSGTVSIAAILIQRRRRFLHNSKLLTVCRTPTVANPLVQFGSGHAGTTRAASETDHDVGSV